MSSVLGFLALAAAWTAPAEAQPVIGGVIIGVPVTDAFSIANGSLSASRVASANDYTVGPFVEVKLPFKFSIEADALYRGYDFGTTFGGSKHASRWDFPILAKYHFLGGPVKPFVDGGLDFSHLSDVATTITTNHNTNFGIVLGAGVQVHVLVLRLSPEIRYTGDFLKNFNGLVNSNQSQVAFLVGIGF